jgi:hypothetical protein
MALTGTAKSEIEFTEQYPLIVTIGKFGNKWDIDVSNQDKFPQDGKLYSDKMFERIQKYVPGGKDQLKSEWLSRLVVSGPKAPHFMLQTDHHPIVVWPGETVQFQCATPFVIWAHRDPNVVPVFASPENLFGWTVSQKSTTTAPYTVRAVAVPNIRQQRFYKTVAWVQTDQGTVLVDPDGLGLDGT